jgi:DNA-binding transcriptional LysR family regulator
MLMLESDVSFRLLDLNLLRVLDAMMAEGSVAGAATRLRITPSAVSHALGRLRALFNDPLFIRSPGGMRATPRAAEIGIKVREGLHYLEGALTPTTFVAAESRRTFTVACSAYVSAVLLPGVIARLRSCAPKAGINVVSWGPGVFDRFEAGQIDVLLGDFVRMPEGYESRMLFEDRLVWLMGRDYVLEPRVADRRRQLQALSAGLSNRSILEYGFVRRVTLDECCGFVGDALDPATDGPVLESLPYSLIAPLLVKQADLAALLPRRLAELFAQDLRLDIIEPAADGGAEIRIAAVCHPDYGRRAPVAWFCALLAAVSAEVSAEVGVAAEPVRSWGDMPIEPRESEKDIRGSSRTLSPAEDEGHGDARLGDAKRR